MQGTHESGAILEFAVDRLESLLHEQPGRISARSVEPRHHLVFVEYRLHEALVVGRVDGRRVPACGHDAERLVVHVLEHTFVDAGGVAEYRHLGLQALFVELLQQSINARKPRVHRVNVRLDLRYVGAVIDCIQGRP